MLSDICSDFFHDIEGLNDDVVRGHLDYLKNGIKRYREGSVIKYDPEILDMMDKFVTDFEEQRIDGTRLREMLVQVIRFFDDPHDFPTSVLFERLTYKPQ